MADLKKILNKLKDLDAFGMEELTPDELEELEGGTNLGCSPKNSGCTVNDACPST